MAGTWETRFDEQEQRMGVAALFLTNLVEGDIDLPDETVDQAESALKELTQSGSLLAALRRKITAAGADQEWIMAQPAADRRWNEITGMTDQVLQLQSKLIAAHDNGQIELVSRAEMESIKGARLNL